MEMTKYKLADLCVSITDGEHGSVKDDSGSTYFLLNNNNITESGIVINSKDRRISKKDFEKIHKRTNLECGDLVIATCGTLGKTCVIKDSLINYEFSRSVGIIKCNRKKLLPEYLHYFFLNPLVQSRIVGNAKGGVQKHFYIGDMKDFEIQIPILAEQKKIASVLSALDDKIALNKKMNQKLEAMAKRLYDYWFVQYDFPDKNGHPYKTTGGPMTYNPTLKREIPAGWEVSNICPLMEILPGGTPSKAKPEYWNGEIPFFGPTDYCGDVFQLSTEEHITENGLNNCASALYPPKTIFITARGSVGKLIVCGKPMAMNQSCYALKPFDLEKYEYLFYLTKQLIEQLKKKGSGSVFKSINTLDIEQSFLSIAPNEIIDLYCKKVKSIFERIKSNTVEIAKLTALRDKLLPLLMNGQVTIK